jgi:hypothetical protein
MMQQAEFITELNIGMSVLSWSSGMQMKLILGELYAPLLHKKERTLLTRTNN